MAFSAFSVSALSKYVKLFASAIPNSKSTVHCGIDGSAISSSLKLFPFILLNACISVCWSLLLDNVVVKAAVSWTFSGKFSKNPRIVCNSPLLDFFCFSHFFKVLQQFSEGFA